MRDINPKRITCASHVGCLPYADMHMHLDFCSEPCDFLEAVCRYATSTKESTSAHKSALHKPSCEHSFLPSVLCAQTVRPSAYLPARNIVDTFLHSLSEPIPLRIITGLGFHPWWIADGTIDENEYAHGLTCIKDASLIGEIGIDGKVAADAHDAKLEHQILEKQVAVFTEICKEAVRSTTLEGFSTQKKILSIHAVNYKGSVVDILSRTGALEACTPIFHWFSLDGSELVSAIGAGCYFSVNERMCSSKRGKSYIAQIPLSQLVLETDFPRAKGEHITAEMWRASLERSICTIAQIKSVPEDRIAQLLYAQSLRILEIC